MRTKESGLSSRLSPSKRRPREEARVIVVANSLPNRETPTSSPFILACYSNKRGGLEAARPSSSVKQNDQSKRSKELIVVENDIPAAKMTEQAGESCHDCVK